MLQSDDRFKHYSWCIRWIQKSPQFWNNFLNSFDLEKLFHQSLFLGLVSIEPVLHCTRNIWLPNSIATKIWILSLDRMVRVSLSDTSIKVLLFTVRINRWVKLHFSVMWWAWSSIWLCFKPFLLSSAFLMLANTWTFLEMVSSYIAVKCNPIILLISN